MKTVRHRKRATAKLRTNFHGVNDGRPQAMREIMRVQGAGSQRSPSEVSSPIRSAYTISVATFGNGVSTLTRATTMQLVVTGECCAVAPGPQVIVSKCSPRTEM